MSISNFGNTKKLLDQNNLKIKKKFGQNFLVDENIINKIIEKSDITKETAVIEIGPGLGALTEKLLHAAGHVMAYEIDDDLIPILTNNFKDQNHFTLIHQDILKSDVEQDIAKHLKGFKEIIVVANLPYYITTPILLGLIEKGLPIDRYVCMMQKEVALRLTGKPSTKDYNSLSIAIQYRTTGKIVINVPKNVFVPAPNVDSSVIRLDKLPQPAADVKNEEHFFKLVRGSFTQRRKTLLNNLQLILNISKEEIEEELNNIGISPQVRAEALSIQDFSIMSDVLGKYLK